MLVTYEQSESLTRERINNDLGFRRGNPECQKLSYCQPSAKSSGLECCHMTMAFAFLTVPHPLCSAKGDDN